MTADQEVGASGRYPMSRVRANYLTAPYEITRQSLEIGLTATLTATGLLDGSVGGADGRIGGQTWKPGRKLPSRSIEIGTGCPRGARKSQISLSAPS